jgi:hypothetical protein
MHALPETVKNLPRLTPGELGDRRKDSEAAGNKAAFLRAARGTMSEAEAARLQKLIDDSCEQLDE